MRLDLLVAHTPFEREALTRRRRVRVGLIETWVVTPEDLIVYKLIAGRPRDLDDVADVASAAEPIDWTYVERWAQAWGVLDRLDRLRGQAG